MFRGLFLGKEAILMTKSYSSLQIVLHWAIAGLIAANYLISDDMEQAFDTMMQGGVVTGVTPVFHVWAGVAVLGLVLVRLLVRGASAGWQQEAETLSDRAALWGHRALYALMVAVPALGAISWFGGIDATAELHVLVMNVMMLLVLGHAAMALVHQYVLRDGLLMKMLRPR
jgi:cytochrome b561